MKRRTVTRFQARRRADRFGAANGWAGSAAERRSAGYVTDSSSEVGLHVPEVSRGPPRMAEEAELEALTSGALGPVIWATARILLPREGRFVRDLVRNPAPPGDRAGSAVRCAVGQRAAVGRLGDSAQRHRAGAVRCWGTRHGLGGPGVEAPVAGTEDHLDRRGGPAPRKDAPTLGEHRAWATRRRGARTPAITPAGAGRGHAAVDPAMRVRSHPVRGP